MEQLDNERGRDKKMASYTRYYFQCGASCQCDAYEKVGCHIVNALHKPFYGQCDDCDTCLHTLHHSMPCYILPSPRNTIIMQATILHHAIDNRGSSARDEVIRLDPLLIEVYGVKAGCSFNSVTISPDGQIVMSGSDDGTIKVWGVR